MYLCGAQSAPTNCDLLSKEDYETCLHLHYCSYQMADEQDDIDVSDVHDSQTELSDDTQTIDAADSRSVSLRSIWNEDPQYVTALLRDILIGGALATVLLSYIVVVLCAAVQLILKIVV